jgi:hypothetical protein
MADNPEIANALTDVRKAQRLLVAFHQRIMPAIQQIADRLRCEFDYSYPVNHSAPPRGTTSPFGRWYWDFSPLSDTVFFFFPDDKENSKEVTPGNWCLTIRLQTDTGISDSFTEKGKNWDAVNLNTSPEESQTQLVVSAFRPAEEIKGNWVWWNMFIETCAQFEHGEVVKGYNQCEAYTHVIAIEDLVAEGSVESVVNEFEKGLLEHQFVSTRIQRA